MTCRALSNSDSYLFFLWKTHNFNFEFFQYLTVTNPNRDEFSHLDSSCTPASLWEIDFIPAGRIGGGGSQKISAKFDLQKYPLSSPLKAAIGEGSNGVPVEGFAADGMPMEIQTRMKLEGKVGVLKVFIHGVVSGVKCEVMIESKRGTVLGFRC
ncbi:uncharacterized protein [Primulina huaijiensis]|uniref:uncharacterized protein n=1 Tax=Primulina huaijiensis TaxID=1492673 RepID=UPI003CC756DE